MEQQQPSQERSTNDEIDLGQIFELIGKGFQALFKAFLKFFIYLKKNAIKLAIIIVVGGMIGFGLSLIVTNRLKTEVIVKPNLGSEAYLYDVVKEIEANLLSQDAEFFNSLEISVEDLVDFDIEISPIEQEGSDNLKDEVEYLKLLEKFRDEVGILDVVLREVLKNSTINHRIVFYYKDAGSGRDISEKLMAYINNNDFYKELTALYVKNAEERIQKNEELVVQIDNIITGYTAKIAKDRALEGSLVLSDEERLDVPSLLRLKNELIADSEKKRLEIQGNVDAIRIISFGGTQEIAKAFFGNTIILVPTVLLGLFLLIDFAKYLNRKAKEMNLE